MGKLHFWMGLGAAQAGAESKPGQPTSRRQQLIGVLVGILLAVLIAVGLLVLLVIDL